MIEHPPIEPIAALPQWQQALTDIASKPLGRCADLPRIARRFEAWWSHDTLDRPIIIGEANGNPSRPITRRLDLLYDADAWFDAKKADLDQLHPVGDTVPAIRVDLGPVCVGPLIGAAHEFGADTSWTHAFINDDWSNEPDWRIDTDGKLWHALVGLVQRVAEDAAGDYVVCTPDLGGSADVLLNLRGPDNLCMDVFEKPDFIKDRIDGLYDAWRQTFVMLYNEAVTRGAGVVHWHRLWSDKPYMIPACDFNFMIGPEHFRQVCLPDIARQVATARRAVFHLDGPGAARHVDDLLDVPGLEAIQFTPGEGTPSVIPWLSMFQRVQDAGRSLFIITPADEVLDLCDALDHKGLGIWISGRLSPDELDDLFAAVCKRYGVSA